MDRNTSLPNSSIDILPNEILFDLSETIFDNAGSNYRDLLAFGLTCKDFFEPAMSVMWKDLDTFGFRPIVSCLPEDAIETRCEAKFPDPVTHVIGSLYVPGRKPDYRLRLLRQIRSEDFKRLYFYGSFVRKFYGNCAPRALVHELCRHVERTRPQRPLFPKLKSLSIGAEEFSGDAKLPRLLMGNGAQCLETVSIDYNGENTVQDYRSMWANMATIFQPSQSSIKSFDFTAWDSVKELEYGHPALKLLTNQYCKFVEKLKNLTFLELDGITIDPQFFRHVATLMQLESFGFWPSRVDMSVLEDPGKHKYFPSLHTLALHTNDYASIVGLQNYFKDIPLKVLKHVQHGSGSSVGFTDYIQSFQGGRWCETVTAVGLIVFPTIYDSELARQELLMVNSVPEALGAFKELQRIRINPSGIDPSDSQFFARAAKAFPKLRKLDIGNDLIDTMELPPFSYFLTHLSDIPHIDQFAVVVDATKLPSEQEQRRLKPHPNLRVIGVSDSIISRKGVRTIISLFRRFLPNVKRIVASQSVGMGFSDFEEYSKLWREVERAL